MKKLVFLWTLVVVTCLQTAAQKTVIDSLENLLISAKDTTRVNLLNRLSEVYARATNKKAAPYAEEALILSEKLNFQYGVAASYRTKAIVYFFNNDHQKAIEYLLISADKAASIKRWSLEAQNYLNLGGLYTSVLGNYSQGMEYYTKALHVYESHNLEDKIYDAYGGIAGVYSYQKEYDKALDYFMKSIKILETKSDHNSIGIAFQKVGDIYMEKKNLDEAEKYYEKSLVGFKAGHSDGGTIVTLVRLSEIFRQRKDFDKALANDLEANELSKKLTYERAKFYSLESLGKTYQSKKEYSKSKDFFEQAIAIAQRGKMAEKLMDNYKNLAEVCMSLHDFEKAFEYQKLHTAYADSVRSKERTNQLAEMEVRFETDRKEKENELLKKDNDLQKLYAAMAVISLISIVIIAVLFFNRQRIKINSTKILAEKEKKLLEADLKNTQLSEAQLRTEIEFKNKELTTYTLNLIQKNEILEELKTTLEQIRMTPSQELSSKLNGLISSVNFSFHLDREWDGFKKHFEEVHESFFEKLRTRFPELNMNDMKLCALLKLNLETKEVATILGISPDSTKVARHRLRKKLNLPTEQNLSSFLATI